MRTHILCRNGLHEMNDANRGAENRCIACRKASAAKKRERIRADPKARARAEAATAKNRAWTRFSRLTTPKKKLVAATELFAEGWAQESDLPSIAEGVARARMQYLSVRPNSPTEEMLLEARALILKSVEDAMAAEKKNPLAHLNVKPDAERAWDRFDKALKAARLASTPEDRKKNPPPNCQDRPAEFVDYDEDHLPTSEEAYRLCHGDGLTTPKCPLLELCSVWAEQERPAYGVWAGEVFLYGEPVNNE